MDKPVSLSVKNWIIRQMSVKTFIQESIIEMVVNHQFDAAYTAIDNCESIEFSGFGRFYFNRKKGFKKLEKMQGLMKEWNRLIDDPSTTETKRKSVEYKLRIITKTYEQLNIKLNGQDTVA